MVRALLLCLTIACAAPASRRVTPVSKPPTATQILERMASTYKNARSYADRGRMHSVSSTGHTHTLTFSTAFIRPDQFRFEYHRRGDPKLAYIIWLAGGDAYSTWYVRPDRVEVDDDLAMPLGAATGVSRGTSSLVPSLLMPELGPVLRMLAKPQLDGEDSVGGRRCWRIRAEDDGEHTTLWIDRETYVLRRIASHNVVEPDDGSPRFAVDETIDYEPRLNEAIAAADLQGPDISQLQVHKREPPKWIGVFFENGTTTVKQVLANGPAAQAGLVAGDRIVTFDGKPVSQPGHVIGAVATHQTGDRVELAVDRAGTALTLSVTIAIRPDMDAVQRNQLLDKPAPDLSLTTLDGKPLKLSAYKGKVVVIDFWATWCRPCIVALPYLIEWHRTLGPRGLVIIGITPEEPATVRPFVAQHGIVYPVALDPAQDTWRAYLVQGIPTTVIVDKAGVVRFVETGLGDPALVEKAITGLLK